jgi:hypothetical protein
MKGLVTLAVIAVLATGLIGTWAFSQVTDDVGAAPPPPSPQQVREQNLDGSGFIRVHEQGTANVNVTNGSLPVSGTVNVGNAPAVQDVNVVSMPAPTGGRLIDLGTMESNGGTVVFPLADVRDCGRMTFAATADESGSFVFNGGYPPMAYASADGTEAALVEIRLEGTVATGGVGGRPSATIRGAAPAVPYLQIPMSTGPSAPPWNVTGWIWCEP